MITFLNEPVLLFAQLNGFKYFYLTQIILFMVNHLFAHIWTVSSIAMLQLQFNISHLFARIWMKELFQNTEINNVISFLKTVKLNTRI